MVKLTKNFLCLFWSFLASVLLLSFVANSAAPNWAAGTPKIVNGATSMDIKVNLDQKGMVYFAVYKVPPTSPTAASVKRDATANRTSNLVQNGTISINEANSDYYAYLKGMAENTTYYTLLVSENSAGELQDTKSLIQLTNVFPSRQIASYYSTDIVPGTFVSYLAYFPEEYYRDSTKNFPFLVMFHGQDEKAWPANVISKLTDKLLVYGPQRLISQGRDFPFVVITPQLGFAGWDEYTETNSDGSETQRSFKGAFMADIVEHMHRRYHLDPSRLYITGLSLGGGGTFSFFQQMPEKIAAAVPIAGWGNPTPSVACGAKDVPVRAFFNENDYVCSGPQGQSVIDAINDCKPRVPAQITRYLPGLGHGGWDETYSNFGKGNIYDWFLTNVKGNELPEDGTNSSPTVYGGSDLTFNPNPGKIVLNGKASDSDGKIVKYQWKQMSGPVDAVMESDDSPSLTLRNMAPGIYKFRLTAVDDGGRSAFDEVLIRVRGDAEIVTAIQDPFANNFISVSPNPVIDNIHLSLPKDMVGKVTLTLSDIHGQVLTNELATSGNGEIVMNYNVQQGNLPKGVYLLKVTSAHGMSQTVKLLKD